MLKIEQTSVSQTYTMDAQAGAAWAELVVSVPAGARVLSGGWTAVFVSSAGTHAPSVIVAKNGPLPDQSGWDFQAYISGSAGGEQIEVTVYATYIQLD